MFIKILVVFLVAQSGSLTNAGGVGHQVGNGALLHHSAEEMTLGSSGKDAHILTSVDANGAMDIARVDEVYKKSREYRIII